MGYCVRQMCPYLFRRRRVEFHLSLKGWVGATMAIFPESSQVLDSLADRIWIWSRACSSEPLLEPLQGATIVGRDRPVQRTENVSGLPITSDHQCPELLNVIKHDGDPDSDDGRAMSPCVICSHGFANVLTTAPVKHLFHQDVEVPHACSYVSATATRRSSMVMVLAGKNV